MSGLQRIDGFLPALDGFRASYAAFVASRCPTLPPMPLHEGPELQRWQNENERELVRARLLHTYACPACRDTGWILTRDSAGREFAAKCVHAAPTPAPQLLDFPANLPTQTWPVLGSAAAPALAWQREGRLSWLHVGGPYAKTHALARRLGLDALEQGLGVRYLSACDAPRTSPRSGGPEGWRPPCGDGLVILGQIDRRLTPTQRWHVLDLLAGLRTRPVLLLGEQLAELAWEELRLELDATATRILKL